MTENINQLENVQIIKKQKHKILHEQPSYPRGVKFPIPECCGVNCPQLSQGCKNHCPFGYDHEMAVKEILNRGSNKQ